MVGGCLKCLEDHINIHFNSHSGVKTTLTQSPGGPCFKKWIFQEEELQTCEIVSIFYVLNY